RARRACEERSGAWGPRERRAGVWGRAPRWSDGQPQIRATAGMIGMVLQCERASVRFGNLAAQHESDPRSARLGREERHEQVRCRRQASALIVDPQTNRAAFVPPADTNPATGLDRG